MTIVMTPSRSVQFVYKNLGFYPVVLVSVVPIQNQPEEEFGIPNLIFRERNDRATGAK